MLITAASLALPLWPCAVENKVVPQLDLVACQQPLLVLQKPKFTANL